MNTSIIRYIVGYILKIEAALLLIPSIVAAIYREPEGLCYLSVSALCIFLGVLLSFRKPKNHVFYLKEGCVATSLSWIVLSFFGSIPFLLTGEITSVPDALFETISGFTTTGASVLNNVEALSHCSLFWRSFTHWVGGMGVLVFLLSLLPLTGGSHVNLMKAESPGPQVDKLVPKVQSTAKILYGIYFALTVLELVFLLAGGMPLFEAMLTSFGTAGTGGFGNWNNSIAHYNSAYLQNVITVFMILFGINFSAYFLILTRKFRQAFRIEEIRVYLGVIFVFAGLIAFNVRPMFGSLRESFHHALFQVASIITTTGYSTTDFDLWPGFSRTILVCLMFIGACAGSTGGGIKVSRIAIAVKTVNKELSSLIHPRNVKVLKYEGKAIEHNVLRSINTYLVAYILIFSVSLLLISLDNFDLTTNFTAIAATLNNIGPGLSKVGPTCNFGIFSPVSKYILMFDMLAGRLELFPMLLLFAPRTWMRE